MICQHRFRIERFDVGCYTACPDLAFPIESNRLSNPVIIDWQGFASDQ
uniref:Uncharacterized protein n=1 Tax=Candidatus Kentrum sp. LPFa TaxID=2126335 RepID=A0A450W0Q2_9GAMM|nr:MAG: hypothetical protein BECKLPF1236A_GA0070988_1004019 [Candidatus Kentron sp. LPFa]VFK27175.1 MAG: hypothetical protein BECKLPF1236C_GA0070990_1004320 [Candidatus Kentron sp. LPFa]